MSEIPAHDYDAELYVLSECMRRPECIDEVAAKLKPEHFFIGKHAEIYQAILALHAEGSRPAVDLVAHWLGLKGRLPICEGEEGVFVVAAALGSSTSVPRYVASIWNTARLRLMAEKSREITARCYLATHENVQRFLDDSAMALQAIANEDVKSELVPFHVSVEAVVRDLAIRSKSKTTIGGVSTGFKNLDRHIHGLRGGAMYIIAARPGVGKSALALQMAMRVAQSRTADNVALEVAFFSLEMSTTENAERALSMETSMPSDVIVRAVGFSGHYMHEALEFVKYASNIRLHIDDDANVNAVGVRARTRRLASECHRRGSKIGLVVVDYLQLVEQTMRSKSANRQEEVAQISRSLKKLSKELDVPVIALSQLNRQIENRSGEAAKPRLADLRESGSLEQDADVVLMIHREAHEEGAERIPHSVIVAKARKGMRGEVAFSFHGATTKFLEVEQCNHGDDQS